MSDHFNRPQPAPAQGWQSLIHHYATHRQCSKLCTQSSLQHPLLTDRHPPPMEYAVHSVANFLPSGASGSADTMAVCPSAPAASSREAKASSSSRVRLMLASTTPTPVGSCRMAGE
eukprot:1159566-Pelagomonas_calceolata.AAC.18